MADNEDDVADDGNTNVVRYNVMPSLVALQLMRNRLHLAHTGKKLMKWTALATGKELRKLSKDMVNVYDSFRDDMRQCFMLLARARYFNPYVNDIVVNNPSNAASVKVEKTYKSVSGVKVVQLIIRDNEADSYAHLGIGRGGIVVGEAKRAWRELLKRVIFMSQEREDFMGLELAHKNATKRQNVISKVVIPRLKLTIRYILSELEEKEREDTFRLKRFKELKLKKGKRKIVPGPVCSPRLNVGNDPDKKPKSRSGSDSTSTDKKPSQDSCFKKVVINTDNAKGPSPKPSVSIKSPGTDNSLKDSPLCGTCKQIVSNTLLRKEPPDVETVDKSTSGIIKDVCLSCDIEGEPKKTSSDTSRNHGLGVSGVKSEDDKQSKVIISKAQACGCQLIKIIPNLKCDWFDEILKVDGPGEIELKDDILENIKSIFLLAPTCSESSSKSETTSKKAKATKSCSSCQADMNEKFIEINKCKSCGTLSASVKPCKSTDSEAKVKSKRKPPPKHKCDLLGLDSKPSGTSNTDGKKKVASKFDVRVVKSSTKNKKKTSNDCCCKSDSELMKKEKQH